MVQRRPSLQLRYYLFFFWIYHVVHAGVVNSSFFCKNLRYFILRLTRRLIQIFINRIAAVLVILYYQLLFKMVYLACELFLFYFEDVVFNLQLFLIQSQQIKIWHQVFMYHFKIVLSHHLLIVLFLGDL